MSICARHFVFVSSLLLACDGDEETPADDATGSTSTSGPSSAGSAGSSAETSAGSTSVGSTGVGSTGFGSTTNDGSSSGGSTGAGSSTGVGSSSTGNPNVCGPPSPGDAATVSLEGTDFDAVDAVAVVTEMVDVATENGTNPFRTELRIRLSANADACSREDEGIFRRGETFFQLVVFRNADDAQPGLPEPGTYPFDDTLPMTNDGTTYFRGGGVLFDCQEECELCASIIENPQGSITFSAVSPDAVAGTFQYTDSSGTYSGSFDAPICGSTDPDAAQCCWTPE